MKNLLNKLRSRYNKLKQLEYLKSKEKRDFKAIGADYLAKRLLIPSKDNSEHEKLANFLKTHGIFTEKSVKIPSKVLQASPYNDLIRNHKLTMQKQYIKEKIAPKEQSSFNTIFGIPEHKEAALEALRHIKHYNMPINQSGTVTRNWKDLQKDAEKDKFHPLNHTYIDDGETKLTGKQIIEKLLASKPKLPSGKSGISFNLTRDQSPSEIDLLKRRMGLISNLKKIKDKFNKGIDYIDKKFEPVGHLVNKGLEKLDSGVDAAKNLLVNPGSSNVLPTEPTYSSPNFEHTANTVNQLSKDGLKNTVARNLLRGIDRYIVGKTQKGLRIDPGILHSALGRLPNAGLVQVLPPHIDTLFDYAKTKYGQHFLPESKFDTKFNSIEHHFRLKPEQYGRKQAIKNKLKTLYDELMIHQTQNGGKIAKDAYNSILDKNFGHTPAVRTMMDKAIREGFTKKS